MQKRRSKSYVADDYADTRLMMYDDLFRVDEYLALNSDLQAAFGTDRQAALLHWLRYVECGKLEIGGGDLPKDKPEFARADTYISRQHMPLK